MKFSIRDLLLITVMIGLALAWWREHSEAVRARREALATERLYGEVRDRAVKEAEQAHTALANTVAAYQEIAEDQGIRLPRLSPARIPNGSPEIRGPHLIRREFRETAAP